MDILQSFASQGFLVQLIILLGCSVSIILVFALLFRSIRDSLHLFLDTGSLTNIPSSKKVLLGLVETFFGIMLIGAISSTITSGILQKAERNRLLSLHGTIKEAFDVHPLIATRKLVTKLELPARLRAIDISEAEIRLEVARDDLVKAIQTFGALRLRWMRESGHTVIEEFQTNRSYGALINRHSPITIVATQNYSDAGIGHFAATLANSLHANYISNEFYSTGAPLKSHQL